MAANPHTPLPSVNSVGRMAIFFTIQEAPATIEGQNSGVGYGITIPGWSHLYQARLQKPCHDDWPGSALLFRWRSSILSLIRAKQAFNVTIIRQAKKPFANALHDALGNQAARAVEDVMNLVIVRVGIAAHAEKFRAGFPHGYRDVI